MTFFQIWPSSLGFMAEMPHVCGASNHVQMQEKILHPSRQHPTHHGIVSIVVLRRSAYGKSAYPTFQSMTHLDNLLDDLLHLLLDNLRNLCIQVS